MLDRTMPARRESVEPATLGLSQDGFGGDRLSGLAQLASVQIETTLVGDLSGTLHSLFDPVCDGTLPIYFGPLLGRLYLEGL